MSEVVEPVVTFEDLPEFAQKAALEVIVYRLTQGEETGVLAEKVVEDTKRVFLKLYE